MTEPWHRVEEGTRRSCSQRGHCSACGTWIKPSVESMMRQHRVEILHDDDVVQRTPSSASRILQRITRLSGLQEQSVWCSMTPMHLLQPALGRIATPPPCVMLFYDERLLAEQSFELGDVGKAREMAVSRSLQFLQSNQRVWFAFNFSVIVPGTAIGGNIYSL